MSLMHFQALYGYVEKLEENKADKENVRREIDVVSVVEGVMWRRPSGCWFWPCSNFLAFRKNWKRAKYLWSVCLNFWIGQRASQLRIRVSLFSDVFWMSVLLFCWTTFGWVFTRAQLFVCLKAYVVNFRSWKWSIRKKLDFHTNFWKRCLDKLPD